MTPSGPPVLAMCDHVVRLGGSLLTLSDLSARLRQFLKSLSGTRVLLIVGGGRGADLIRELHDKRLIDAHQAHWMAIAAMSDNAEMLQRLLPEFRVCGCTSDMQAVWMNGHTPVLDAARFLRPASTPVMPSTDGDLSMACRSTSLSSEQLLPESWDVTSDSIALWVSRELKCSNVWLLKSCDGPTTKLSLADLQTLAAQQLVDAHCPALWHPMLVVHWRNLRANTDHILQTPASC